MMASIHLYNEKWKLFIYDLENNVIQNEIEIDLNIELSTELQIDFSCNNRYLAFSKNDS